MTRPEYDVFFSWLLNTICLFNLYNKTTSYPLKFLNFVYNLKLNDSWFHNIILSLLHVLTEVYLYVSQYTCNIRFMTKLGTYLALKRIWNPIDFQGQRSRSLGQIFMRGDTPRFALPLFWIQVSKVNLEVTVF
jgi:hypothetical protein